MEEIQRIRTKSIQDTLNYFPELNRVAQIEGITDLIMTDPEYKCFLIQVKGKNYTEYFENLALESSTRMINFVTEIARLQGLIFSETYPFYSTEIPILGYRMVAQRSPFVPSFNFSIRFGNRKIFPLESFCNSKVTQYLINLIQDLSTNRKVVVAGGTSTGKTSFLNAWLAYMDKSLRVVTVENMREISLPKEQSSKSSFFIVDEGNWFFNEQGVKINPYLASLNMLTRSMPQFIVFGELTTSSTYYWLRSCNLACHSVTTLHADSPSLVKKALHDNVVINSEGKIRPSDNEIYALLSHIVQLKRDAHTGERSASVFSVEYNDSKDEYFLKEVVG